MGRILRLEDKEVPEIGLVDITIRWPWIIPYLRVLVFYGTTEHYLYRVSFPSYTIHILQPLDVSVFQPYKH